MGVMLSREMRCVRSLIFFFFQAEDGIRDYKVTGVQTCALPILFGDESDDNAVAYYRVAKRKGVLATLTLAQRIRLIRLGLDGPTLGDDEEMIVEIGRASCRERV